ncbi:hypothetical protein SCHPADRAFT_879924 [Schizopora paradoxa]|uniref:TPR-like protein n=1 Tax=Schizopora paradoxa TaxID=27342 RepID=A0A0H2RW32_9AGAM|nr:hypothetical protein SCHPADRAFT_879924 [Schizopora paradoxa]
MEKDLNRVLARFHLEKELQLSADVEKTVKDLCCIKKSLEDMHKTIAAVDNKLSVAQARVDDIQTSVQAISLANPLSKLPYAEGASWDIGKICQEGTRESILAEIVEFVRGFQGEGTARIFCLTGAPGAGKTAIAHSISKICHDAGWLATSFFYNREDSTRAPKLFSTIIHDLAARYQKFKVSVGQAIEQDPSLASASLTQHFYKLILPFSHQIPQDKPIVIVLDALDEGYSDVLMEILVKGVSSLRGGFKFVVTARNVAQMQEFLREPHVHHKAFGHSHQSNMEDVGMVVQRELSKVALKKGLSGTGWPTKDQEMLMKEKSGGLMIWVITVCHFLSQPESLDPRGELEALLEKTSLDSLGAEEQMDLLYVTILKQWNWFKKGFTEAYKQVMGTILVSKIPMSESAIQSLYSGKSKITMLLSLLRPLLVQSEGDQSIQILHQSLHDFLASRAHLVNEWKNFAIDEKVHHQILVLRTITVLNTELTSATPGTGYTHQNGEMPKFPERIIPEHLRYACKFWMEHLKVVQEPNQELIDVLSFFLEHKFVLWLELSACMWQIVEIEPLIKWIDMCPSPIQLQKYLNSSQHSQAFLSISGHLGINGYLPQSLLAAQYSFNTLKLGATAGLSEAFQSASANVLCQLSTAQGKMGMRKDALEAVKEAVAMQREIAKENPAAFNADLALSLGNLSNRLSEMGLRDEALQAIREAVAMQRGLANGNPAAFKADLARSLGNLSNRLSDIGAGDEALQTIREAVAMQRELANGNPVAFNAGLALSLGNLSNRLSEMGLRDEALQAIREAVAMQRELANGKPAAFKADLTRSLGNLSTCFSEMGLRDEALQTIREAVAMRRELAKENPAAFNADLALSLGNLSNRLSDVGARDEALQAIREAVHMYRGLSESFAAAFSQNLADSLCKLSYLLSEMEEAEEALQSVEEAVQIFRDIAATLPNAFHKNAAWAKQRLSFLKSNL